MSITPFDSALYGQLLSDAGMADIFSDKAQLTAMVTFERALARVQGRLDVIPAEAAEEIDRVLLGFDPDPAALAETTEANGVPVPGLVQVLRSFIGGDSAAFLHWGATSQDVMDTAIVLQISKALTHLDGGLTSLITLLLDLAEDHRTTVVSGRTRWQPAVPTSFGLKVAGWADPLLRHRQRLDEFRDEVLLLSFGGAAGNLSALGDDGMEVAKALSRELDLTLLALPWHNRRDGLALLVAHVTTLTMSLGKMAQDVILMSQGEVGELREGGVGRGGSSTMPNKTNPVRSEAIIALARYSANLTASMQAAVLHAHERDGAAWQTEWFTLAQAFTACGAALGHADALIADIDVDPERMRENIEATNGMMLAEAASFALSDHMTRVEAQALVKKACKQVVEEGRHLFDILEDLTDVPVNWSDIRDPGTHMGEALTMLDLFLTDEDGAV